MEILKKLKKHAAIPTFIAAVFVLVFTAVNTYALKDNGTFYLQDLEGDRNVMNEVTISGELLDGYHRTSFRIKQGAVGTETQIYSQPKRTELIRSILGSKELIGGMEYYVYNTRHTYEVFASKIRSGFSVPEGKALITPNIEFHGSSNNNYSITFTNPLEYGLAKIGDKVFFTVPTTSDYTGMNGIYELDFSKWNAQPYERKKSEAQTVVELSLESNGNGGKDAGIEIIGLEAVGEKLALLIIENNQFKIRSYDSENGTLLGEEVIPGFHFSDRVIEDGVVRPVNETHSMRYEAFRDDKQNILNLSFDRIPLHTGQLERTLLSLDFSKGVDILTTVQTTFNGKEDSFTDVSYLHFQDGKLYAVKTLKETESELGAMFDIVLPKRFSIYVFKQSELIYRGELMTDLNDDNIRAINETSEGFSYEQGEYRFFDNVLIE